MAQVVTISPDGSISCLQAKPGKGADFRKLGRAEISRASEVLWDQDEQAWYVQIVRGRYNGAVISTLTMAEIGLDRLPVSPRQPVGTGLPYFWEDYDDAVKGEIAFLDHVRKYEGAAALL
jgi:hypothetical protein